MGFYSFRSTRPGHGICFAISTSCFEMGGWVMRSTFMLSQPVAGQVRGIRRGARGMIPPGRAGASPGPRRPAAAAAARHRQLPALRHAGVPAVGHPRVGEHRGPRGRRSRTKRNQHHAAGAAHPDVAGSLVQLSGSSCRDFIPQTLHFLMCYSLAFSIVARVFALWCLDFSESPVPSVVGSIGHLSYPRGVIASRHMHVC